MSIRSALRSSWPILVLTAALLLTLVLIPPTYEVPQNDDWANRMTIQNWLQTGHLTHIGWNDPTLLFQIVWGSLFARLFGPTYTSLRTSTLILSWAGVLSLYGILRHLRWSKAAALLGAGLLLMNPIYLVLSYSFNTDVPYVALATFSTILLLKAEERRSPKLFLFTGIAIAAAFLVRQQGLVLGVIAAAWVFFRAEFRGEPAGRRRVVAALILGPVVIAVFAYGLWFHGASGGSWPWQLSNRHPAFKHPDPETIQALFVSFLQGTSGLLMTIAFLLTPLFVTALGPTWASLRRRWSDRGVLALSVSAFVAASFWLTFMPGGGWPYAENSVTRCGPCSLGQEIPLAPWVWWIPNILAPLMAGWVVLSLFRVLSGAIRERVVSPAALVVLLGLGQFLPCLFLEGVYDRYVLVVLPALILAGISFGMPKPRAIRVGLAVLAVCAGLSIEWTRAYVDQARIRWELADDLVQRGALPQEIMAGFEWQGEHLYPIAVRDLHAKPPFPMDGGPPWAPLVQPQYGLLTWEPYLTPIAERSYRPFLGLKRQKIVSVWTMAGLPGFARKPIRDEEGVAPEPPHR